MRRGSFDPSEFELDSCMHGQSPGSPDDLFILGFDKGFHGRTIGKSHCILDMFNK